MVGLYLSPSKETLPSLSSLPALKQRTRRHQQRPCHFHSGPRLPYKQYALNIGERLDWISQGFNLKVAVNTIVPRSPFFFVFVPQNPDCYTHQKKRGRISPSMEWRYLCYLQPLSKAKNPLTPMAKEEVCPRDEIADPPGMAVLPIDIYGFDEGLVSFRTLCGVQSSLVRFAPNQAIDWGPLQWQAWLETLCLSSASS